MDELIIKIGEHQILLNGTKRYYLQNLKERDFSLENTTPYLLKIDGYDFYEGSWVELLRNLASYLLLIKPKSVEELREFQVDWSNTQIFSQMKRVNHRKIRDNLYINCNHTAIHSCWLVKSLLDFFGVCVDDVSFFIHRPSSAEPLEVKKYFEEKAIKEFCVVLKNEFKKNDEQCEKILSNIKAYLDKILVKCSNSFDNFLLFDDKYIAMNYISTIKEHIDSMPKLSERNKQVLFNHLKYLLYFYKTY